MDVGNNRTGKDNNTSRNRDDFATSRCSNGRSSRRGKHGAMTRRAFLAKTLNFHMFIAGRTESLHG